MKQLLYFLSAATLLLTACSKEAPGDAPKGPKEIKFRTYIEEGGEIRPMAVSESRTVAGDLAAGYRLSTLLTTADYPVAAVPPEVVPKYERLMWNVEMNRDGSYKSPTEKRYFWTEGDATLRHTFVAYSADGPSPATLAVDANGQLKVEYTNVHVPAAQCDFLYSENVRNVKVDTSVPVVDLVFKHRMARVMVKLIGTGGATLTKCQAQISYGYNTVKNKAFLTLAENGANDFAYSYHFNGTHNLGTEFSLPGSANTPETAVEVGDMILLPGQRIADGWATLTLTYTPDGGTTPQTASVALPALTLETGMQNDILINVIVETTTLSVSAVTLADWNTKQGGTIDPFK